MAKIESREDLENWLKDKPREWAVAIAARAAMRVLPVLGFEVLALNAVNRWQSSLVLPILRAQLISASVCKYPDAEMAFVADAARAAADAARAAARTADAARAAYAADAARAAYAADAARAANAAAYAARAAYATRTAYAVYAADAAKQIWKSVERDANALEGGVMLWTLPLWQDDGSPNWVLLRNGIRLDGLPDWMVTGWRQLQDALFDSDPAWQTLIRWYEDRLIGDEVAAQAGRPVLREMEIEIALLPDEVWQDARRANEAIREIQERHWTAWREAQTNRNDLPPIEAIPEQEPRAILFGGADNEPIRPIVPPDNGLLDTPEQREGFDAIQDAARELHGRCGQSNTLAPLKSLIERLQDNGATFDTLKPRSFWSALNALRKRQFSDQLARNAPDPEVQPLAEDAAGLLAALVHELNLFAAQQPKLADYDRLSRDPSERVYSSEAERLGQELVDAAKKAPGAVSPEAVKELQQAIDDAQGNSPAAERAKEFSGRSVGNLVVVNIKRAGKLLNGLAKGVKKYAPTLYAAAKFVKENEVLIRQIIEFIPGESVKATLNTFVTWIVEWKF